MASIATLEIKVDATGAITSMRQVGREADELSDKTEKTESRFKKLGDAAKVAGGLLAAFIGKEIIQNTIEAEYAAAQLEAAVRSTGGAAGFTAKELLEEAGALQKVTTFGDEALASMQAILLTFTQVRGDNFKRAEVAIADMATRMGTDLKSAAIQVGKALNDPILGVSALNRVGVQMTETQKEMIQKFVEMGDVASAQRIILSELETQFGGSAAAARDTLGGALTAVQNAFGDALEANGAFADGLTGLLTMIADLIPKAREKVDEFFGGLQIMAVDAGVFLADFGNMAQRGFGRALIAVGDFLRGLGEVVPGLAELSVKLNALGNDLIVKTLGDTKQLKQYQQEMHAAIVATDNLTTSTRTLGNVVTESHGDIVEAVTKTEKAHDKARAAAIKQIEKMKEIPPVVHSMSDGLRSDFSPVLETVEVQLDETFGSSMHDKAVAFFTDLHDGARGALSAIQDKLRDVGQSVLSVFGSGAGVVGSFAGGLLGSAIGGMLDDLSSRLFDSGKKFREAVDVWRAALRAMDAESDSWSEDRRREGLDPYTRAMEDIEKFMAEQLAEAFDMLRSTPTANSTPMGRVFEQIIESLTGGFEDIAVVQRLLDAGTFTGHYRDALMEYLEELQQIWGEVTARRQDAEGLREVNDAFEVMIERTGKASGELINLAETLDLITRTPQKGKKGAGGKGPIDGLGDGVLGDDGFAVGVLWSDRDPETFGQPSDPTSSGGASFGSSGAAAVIRTSGIASVSESTGNRILGVLSSSNAYHRQTVQHLARIAGRGILYGDSVNDDVNRSSRNAGDALA